MNCSIRKSTSVLAGLFGLLSLTLAHAEKTGNGGGAWVCRESSNNVIRWIDVVDLWEARQQFDLTLEAWGQLTVDQQIEEVTKKIHQVNPAFAKAFDQEVKHFRQTYKAVKLESELSLIPDANLTVRPKAFTCENGVIKYEQVVNYKSSKEILVDSELLSALLSKKALSQLSEAAIYTHEAVYSLLRLPPENAVDSDKARLITGNLFSTASIDDYKKLLVAPSEFVESPVRNVLQLLASTKWRWPDNPVKNLSGFLFEGMSQEELAKEPYGTDTTAGLYKFDYLRADPEKLSFEESHSWEGDDGRKASSVQTYICDPSLDSIYIESVGYRSYAKCILKNFTLIIDDKPRNAPATMYRKQRYRLVHEKVMFSGCTLEKVPASVYDLREALGWMTSCGF